jgi:hypothetical protein
MDCVYYQAGRITDYNKHDLGNETSKMLDVSQPTAFDCFSGCGGMTEGFRQAGYRVVGAIEIDPYALVRISPFKVHGNCILPADFTHPLFQSRNSCLQSLSVLSYCKTFVLFE